MKMVNASGQHVYYNVVTKAGKIKYVVKAIDGQDIIGRDKQKRKSRIFTRERDADKWLERNGYKEA